MFAEPVLTQDGGASALFFEDLAVGTRASLRRRVETAGAVFAAISETETAHAGARTLPAQTFGPSVECGFFATNLVGLLLGTELPGPGAVCLSQRFDFLGPLRVGDVVTASVEIAELVESRCRARLICECATDRHLVLEGEAWVAVSSRASSLA